MAAYRVLLGTVVVAGVGHERGSVVELDAADGAPLCDGPAPVLAAITGPEPAQSADAAEVATPAGKRRAGRGGQ